MLRLVALSLCVLSLLAATAGSVWLVLAYDRSAHTELVRLELATLTAAVLAAGLALALPRAGASWGDRLRAALPFGAAVLCVAALVVYVDVHAGAPVHVADAYADWLQYRSRHFLFVYPPTSTVAADIGQRARVADGKFDAIAGFFATSFDRRIVVYVHEDAEQGSELLGHPLPWADTERLEVHLLPQTSAARWAALVVAEKAWGGPPGTALLGEGVPAYLDGQDSDWPAALSYLKGDLPPLEALVDGADEMRGGDLFAASFVGFLLSLGTREALGKLWVSPAFRGSVYQAYGKRADQLEAAWHDRLAALLGFRSAAGFEATASTEVALDSPQAGPVRGLVERLGKAVVAGRLDQARAVLAAQASPGAQRALRTLIEKEVSSVELIGLNDYGGKCLLADLHISTTVEGRPFEMDADAVLSAGARPQVLHLAFR